MTDDHPPGTADVIDTATAYDAALHDVQALTGLDAVADLAAIAAHVDALQAALHATDTDRLRIMADAAAAAHAHDISQRQTQNLLDTAYVDQEHLRDATRRARGSVVTCALAVGHLWPHDAVAAQLADALAHLAQALDAVASARPGAAAHHLLRTEINAQAVGASGLLARAAWGQP